MITARENGHTNGHANGRLLGSLLADPESRVSGAGIVEHIGPALQFRMVKAPELLATPSARYLIPEVLVAGRPGGVFGAFKTLKTSCTLDLLVSVASGRRFLGAFPVLERGPTLYLSGESDLEQAKEIVQRICAARQLSESDLEDFHVSFDLPNLNNGSHVMALGDVIRKLGLKVIAIDPAYLAMDLAGEANNLFAVGRFLKPIATLCRTTGCAILVVHHCKHKVRSPFQPATLADISWSGFAEFAAQWMLLSRRSRFEPDLARHKLWAAFGGRDGHLGQWALDIDESPVGGPSCLHPRRRPDWQSQRQTDTSAERPPDEPPVTQGELPCPLSAPPPRKWAVNLRWATLARMEVEEDAEFRLEQRRARREMATLQRSRGRMFDALRQCPEGETARMLGQTLGMSGTRVNATLASMIEIGIVERVELEKHERREHAYRLCGGAELP